MAALPPLDPAASLHHLERSVETFAGVLRSGDLDARVPACPDWTVTDLAHHLGGVHRWARTAVVQRRPGDAPADRPGQWPQARQELLQWFREGAADLVATLRATAPDAECWTFGPQPGQAAFWFRRQAHETAMHAWDAAAAQGRSTAVFEERLALDGIDEVHTIFFPRQVRLGRIRPLERSLSVEPDGDDGARWVFAADGGGHDAGPEPDAEATVAGPAGVLLLLLWGRTGLEDRRLRVTGDRDVARAVVRAGLTP